MKISAETKDIIATWWTIFTLLALTYGMWTWFGMAGLLGFISLMLATVRVRGKRLFTSGDWKWL